MSNFKPHILQVIEQLHDTENLKVAIKKTFSMLLTVKYSDQSFGLITIKTNQSKIAAIHKIPSPTTKIELKRFNVSMNFYSNFIEKFHVNMKVLCDLLQKNIKFHQKMLLETLIQQIKITITNDVTPTLPNTNHPFYITVDSSLIGIGCVLFQKEEKGKLDFISFISWFFATNEQQLCTTYREAIGIVYLPTIYERNIIDSDNFNNVFIDQKPLLS